MLWICLGLKDLMKNRGFALFFILNLSIGLAGFIAVHSFDRSLNRHLDNNLREILTADLVLSSNSPLTPEELGLADQVLGPDTSHARLIRFYTMVRAGNNTRLVSVMAIDGAYPLYGEFLLEQGTNTTALQEKPCVFLTRDTAHTLGIVNRSDPGSPLTLGRKSFWVKDFFIVDPDKSLTSVELAPKLYMGIAQLDGTGLIQFGSRIRYLNFYRLNREADIPGLARTLRQKFRQNSTGQPRINVYDSRDVNQRLGKVTRYFTQYMGLVSIVALFLAGIATAYLFRSYLNLKQREISILMSIGARHWEIYLYVSCQLIILGGLGSIPAVIISLFLVPAFPVIFQGLIPAQAVLTTDPVTVFLALGMGTAGSLIFCLPVFVRIFGIKPLSLLRPATSADKMRLTGRMIQMASFGPGLVSFFMVAVLVAGSVKSAGFFTGGFVLALAILSVMGQMIFSGCRILSFTQNLVKKIAFRNLFRNKQVSLACFVTISMGVFLICIIPQIQKGLQNEIVQPKGLKIPVFFLVDIQEEQRAGFIEFMAHQNADLTHISPMVRGRILAKNDQPFYDEDPGSGQTTSARRGRRLEFNFSYRKNLDPSETIVQGPPLSDIPWDFESGTPFEISVEASFAERYGLELGDIMEFDIQGIPFAGQVVNLRKVRWNSFAPNFFLLFQDGVLNHAPKTFLAAISQVPPENRQALKNQIVTAFPNVSIIDVTQMAGTLLAIIEQLSLSIGFMAWLAIAAGLVSIFSIARHEAWKNEIQINLLKILGADFREIQAIALLEFGFIGFTAALSGILLSFGCSRAISWYFFDSIRQFDFWISFAILFLTTCICMVTALMASRKVMHTKPVKLLAEG